MGFLELSEWAERLTGGTKDADIAERRCFNSAVHAVMPEPKVVEPLDYETSLDAALTLVPEGLYIELHGPRYSINIPSPVPNFWSANLESFNHERQRKGWGATAALSVCAAALRARAGEW